MSSLKFVGFVVHGIISVIAESKLLMRFDIGGRLDRPLLSVLSSCNSQPLAPW